MALNKKALLKVADKMEEVHLALEAAKAPVEFDLYEWGVLAQPGVFENREDMSCMTAACAIGHCGTLFKDEGFSLTFGGWGGKVMPTYKNWTNWDAVKQFFGLSQDQAMYLFMDTAYTYLDPNTDYDEEYQPMPAEVADRIRRFVRSGKMTY